MLRGFVTLIFVVFNTVSCVSDYEYRNRIAEYPVGFIENYTPWAAILLLFYTILP